jgi:hypothetical protein
MVPRVPWYHLMGSSLLSIESFRRVKVLSPADRRGDPLPAIVKRLQLAVSGDIVQRYSSQ